MINKYLTVNPIHWLLEKSDPSIRYLTLRDIIQDNTENEYDNLLNSVRIKRLLKTEKNQILGYQNKFDTYYKGAMWCFAEAVERGLDRRTDAVDRTAQYIYERCQMPSGGFTLSWKPETEVACSTGDIIKYLILAGYDDQRVEKGINWIINNQRHDGGWLHCPLSGVCDILKLMLFNRAGTGLKREKDNTVKSCFYATIACSMALVNYQRTRNPYGEAIKKAAEFFLRQRLYINSKKKPIKPKKFWNKDFRLVGYPILSQYDILYGLNFIAKAGFFNDSRTGMAFNIIMSKQNNDGTWNLENAQTGMMYGNDRKAPIGEKNKWVTLNVLRMLKHAEDSINLKRHNRHKE